MKTQPILKPLVIAVALAFSVGAFAGGQQNGQNRADGATAEVSDSQTVEDNYVDNHETKNNATVDANATFTGNTGVNVVAGDNNQQANAAAIATADSFFVFGVEANAKIDVDQNGNNNSVDNTGTQNNALVNGTLSSTGNLGFNAAAGNYNQQKNDLAIASSETAYVATASVDMDQQLNDNETINNTGKVYQVAGEDSLAQSRTGQGGPGGNNGNNQTPQTPVVNNASLSGTVTTTGNAGINLAAGAGNQQANSLAIAAGCTACAAAQ
ncbi:hypothetical protein [Pseudomonas sp. Marseille-Q8238]